MPNADVPPGVEHALLREDVVGDDEIVDDGVEGGGVGQAFPLGRFLMARQIYDKNADSASAPKIRVVLTGVPGSRAASAALCWLRATTSGSPP